MKRLPERGWDRDVRRAVNQLMDEMRSLKLVQGVGYRLKSTHLGQVIELERSRSASESRVEVAKFKVVSVYRRRVLCTKVNPDDTDSTEQFNVLLPESIWYDQEITGEGVVAMPSIVSDTEFTVPGTTQTVTCRIYYDLSTDLGTDDYIYAVKSDTLPTYTEPDGTEVVWYDLNVDARQRVMRTYLTEVCVNGQTKYIATQRSEPSS